MDKLTQLIYTFAYHRYYQMFGEDLRLFHSWLGAVYRGQPMSYTQLKKIEAIDVEAMVERGYTILDDVLDHGLNCAPMGGVGYEHGDISMTLNDSIKRQLIR